MNDGAILLFGTISSILIAQATQTVGLPEYITNLSAPGVLAIVFYYILQRYEKRVDSAFKAHAELEERLFNLLSVNLRKEDE